MYLRISSNNCLLRCSTTDSRISWAGCFEVPAGTETDNDCTVARSIEYGLVPSSSGRAGRVTTPPPHIVYFTKDRFFARCVLVTKVLAQAICVFVATLIAFV